MGAAICNGIINVITADFTLVFERKGTNTARVDGNNSHVKCVWANEMQNNTYGKQDLFIRPLKP